MNKPISRHIEEILRRYENRGRRGLFEKLLISYNNRWKGAERMEEGISGVHSWLTRNPLLKEEPDEDDLEIDIDDDDIEGDEEQALIKIDKGW